MEIQKVQKAQEVQRTLSTRLLFFIGGVLLLLFTALAYILSVQSKLKRTSRPGRAVSASIPSTEKLLTTVTRAGNSGDPINIQFEGTDGQVGLAFASAGWYRADEIDFITSVRICVDSVLGRKYSTAPVSNLYLYGRREDMAFERPGGTVRQRDHIRIWNTNHPESDGRPTWIGSATRDTKIELAKTNHLPTHHIDGNVDAERTLVASELTLTGYVIKEAMRSGFGKETHGFNGEGDPYETDGQVAVLTLEDVTTTPLTTQVRTPLSAHIVKRVGHYVHPWHKRQGHALATNELERLKTQDTPSSQNVHTIDK